MAKKLMHFRLDEDAQKHLLFCVAASGYRASKAGLPVPSQGEVVEQALARYARYLSSLKGAGKGVQSSKKAS
jgi:hypothetical protein